MSALVAGLFAIGALGAFLVTRAANRGPSDDDVRAVAASVVATETARLAADGQRLATLSASIGGDPDRADSELHTALGRVTPLSQLGVVRSPTDATAVVAVAAARGAAPTIVGLDLARTDEWRLLLELARDGAQPAAAVATGPDGQPTVVDALALYGTPDGPADIASRRAALQGYVVSFTPSSLLVALPRAANGTDISVRVLHDATVLDAAGADAAGTPPAGATSMAVTANGVAWTVQAWGRTTPSQEPLAVLFGGLLLAALAGAVVASRERSGAAASAATVARNQQLELIARIGSLLQQSLSLGDLLPVFVVEVSDELALHGIGISLIADSGEFVRVFALGTSANEILPDAAALVPPPLAVEPGALVTVPLQRVGRVVGAFQGRATAGLTEAQIDTLLAVCAQLAAAIGNVRLYQDEQEMVARLRDLDHMKTKFVGSVSHELRTSVTAIEGFASLLQGDAEIDPARREDYMERIRRNARSLGLLIEDLLDFARFELSGVTGALRPTDLSDLVPNVVDQMSSVLANRTVSTIVEPNLVGIADALAVERILVNLLSNAAKYTPADSTVTVGLERDGDAAVLTVADNGPGIPAAERERIFDLFYRSDSSSVSARGVGIGLSLARQLVAHLKGTITVDEAPDGGARFRVMIPLAEELNPSPRVPETEQARPRAGG